MNNEFTERPGAKILRMTAPKREDGVEEHELRMIREAEALRITAREQAEINARAIEEANKAIQEASWTRVPERLVRSFWKMVREVRS